MSGLWDDKNVYIFNATGFRSCVALQSSNDVVSSRVRDNGSTDSSKVHKYGENKSNQSAEHGIVDYVGCVAPVWGSQKYNQLKADSKCSRNQLFRFYNFNHGLKSLKDFAIFEYGLPIQIPHFITGKI